MQAKVDIFGIWDSVGDMAEGLERKYDTVLAWRTRGRIPEDAWTDVIAAALNRGVILTVTQILEFNTPIKKRGKPPSKVKGIRVKRAEARAG
jgi:hypothetical protein